MLCIYKSYITISGKADTAEEVEANKVASKSGVSDLEVGIYNFLSKYCVWIDM